MWRETHVLMKILLIFYIVLGLGGGAWGTYDTIKEIVKSFAASS